MSGPIVAWDTVVGARDEDMARLGKFVGAGFGATPAQIVRACDAHRLQPLEEPKVYVLSLWQPWAWLVVHGPKDVENRSWKPPAGSEGREFYVHAAKRCDQGEWDRAAAFAREMGFAGLPELSCLHFGGVVGRVQISGYLAPSESGPRAKWHMAEQWGWQLKKREPVPFVPMRGNQRFWRVPASLIG